MLKQKVDNYNAPVRQLELIPQTAKHTRGKRFEVKLDGDMAAEGVVNLMGGVDLVGVVEPHVTKLVKDYESKTADVKKRIVKDMEVSKEKLVEEIKVSLTQVSCRFHS